MRFPWPDLTERQRSAIETAAQGVLAARAKYPASTLADLYNPLAEVLGKEKISPEWLYRIIVRLSKKLQTRHGKNHIGVRNHRLLASEQFYLI